MKVLITGGAGYIGSTIASCCLDKGITPIILDDFSKGLKSFASQHSYYEGDIADRDLIQKICKEHELDAVIHCAAKIVVPESVSMPLAYYENNVAKSITLLEELEKAGVKRFILSSTASMYKPGPDLMVDEDSEIASNSPYTSSKIMLEQIMQDFAKVSKLKMLALRYFNPIGADPKLRTGLQNPKPSHALGKMLEAYKEHKPFTVTGVDWPTRDGSGLRDYIHVWDLACAHVAALERFDQIMEQSNKEGYEVINLGTGTGTTVFELASAFGEASGRALEIITDKPRPGDVVGCATRCDKAKRLLNWSCQLSIAQGVQHALQFSEKLPAILEQEKTLQRKNNHYDARTLQRKNAIV